jgi:hypothetical protein
LIIRKNRYTKEDNKKMLWKGNHSLHNLALHYSN